MEQYRNKPQFGLGLDELIIDNFAGGGGASTGIEAAIGRPVDVAINHDPDSIAMHKINHPTTLHHCEDVWDVDPREVASGNQVALAWFSPDCKHFSKAKGGKPVDKKIRGLAWLAVRYAATVKPRIICLENVEEFVSWGPVVDGRPCKKRKGITFKSFVRALERNGYKVETNVLRASDYGIPTIRKRLFLVARCDGLPIQWPTPTHGDPSQPGFRKSGLKPWRTAASVIDWSLPCPSIFGRKKPLADNTLRRIWRGIDKFVINNPKPFIVRIGQQGYGGDGLQYGVDQPLTTITSKAEHCLVAPSIVKHYGGGYNGPGVGVDQPVPTITQKDHNALVTSHLVSLRNNCYGSGMNEPLPTICSGGTHIGEVRAFLMKYYSEGGQWQRLDEPMHTIVGKARLGLVTVAGEDYQIVDIGMRMLEPHELFAAQGFPQDYIIDRDAEGNPVPKYKQVARCGNSVPPGLAEALVRANWPEYMEREAVA